MKYDDYLRRLKIALRILGLWRTEINSRSMEFGYLLYSTVFLGIFCIVYNISEFVNLFFIYNEFQAFAADLCWFVMHLTGSLKIVMFLSKIQQVQIICAKFENGLSDDFQTRKNEIEKREDSLIVDAAVRKSIRCLVVYYVLTVAVLLNGFIAPFFHENEGAKELTANITFIQVQKRELQLPYFTYIICDVELSPCYEIAYVYQTLSTCICSLVIIHCDNLYIIMVLLCCSEFKILNKSIEKFIESAEIKVKRRILLRVRGDNPDNPQDAIIDRESLRLGRNCVKHHHAILKISEEIEGIYNRVILAQFLSHLVQLCFQMFLITEVSASSFDGISMIAFIIAMVIEVYVFCQCGNEIETESMRVAEAAYNASWTSSSAPVKRTLLLMMLRAQRPVEFTVGKFAKLSLRTLVSVLRGSTSYFMVLREIQ